MKKILLSLWDDDDGFIVSLELLFIATILVVGLTTGLTNLRDSINGQFSSIGQTINSLNSSLPSSATSPYASQTSGASSNVATTTSTSGSIVIVIHNDQNTNAIDRYNVVP